MPINSNFATNLDQKKAAAQRQKILRDTQTKIFPMERGGKKMPAPKSYPSDKKLLELMTKSNKKSADELSEKVDRQLKMRDLQDKISLRDEARTKPVETTANVGAVKAAYSAGAN